MFTKEESTFLLQAVLASPVSTNIQGVQDGIKISPMVKNLIIKLKAMNDEESEAVGSAEADQQDAPQPEQAV